MKHERGSGAGSVLFAFFLGGIVGAGLTLMLSPLSGTDARRKLSRLGEDLIDKKDEYTDDVREKISDTVQRGKDFVERKKSAVSSAIEAGRDAYEKEKKKHERA